MVPLESGALPNILVIHTDQLRADCLGCTGNRDVRTPYIDGLAAQGVVFENCFCSSPACAPSRYSLLSGRYVHKHGWWSNRCTLPPGTPTFASVLRDAGYHTAAVGKMHFTPTYLDAGFDRMVLCEQEGPGRWDDDYHRGLRNSGLVDLADLRDQRREFRKRATAEYWETFGAIVSNLPEEHHSTTWITDRAVEVVEGWDPRGSNLLMVGYVKPHHPFDPPSPWHRMYDPHSLSVLAGWLDVCLERDTRGGPGYFSSRRLTIPALRQVMAYYYAMISQIDQGIGRVFEALRLKGMEDDTLIVFTSDHGDYMGFHHLLLKGGLSYDPLMRVPLVMRFPHSRRVRREPGLVSNIDVAPTILRAVGIEPPETMTGLNLRRTGVGRDIVFAAHGLTGQTMARTRDFKCIRFPMGPTLLLNLRDDPMEVANAAEGQPAEAEEMVCAIREWRDDDARMHAYVDECAPTIVGPNVPPADRSHRREMVRYFGAREEEAQLGPPVPGFRPPSPPFFRRRPDAHVGGSPCPSREPSFP